MGFILGDASEFYQLANDLSRTTAKTVPAVRSAILAAGEVLRDQWQDNARATSGEHGKHYPDSIEAEMAFGVSQIAVDVGPNPGKKQGGMSFEHGSTNQPPHLDGLRALEFSQARIEGLIDTALTFIFD